MNEKLSREEQGALNQFHDFMVKKMKKGETKVEIVEELVANGMTKKEAQSQVNEGWDFVMNLIEGERFTSSAIVPALIGGIVGAGIGAGFWAVIVIVTSLKSSWMATGVGVIVGFSIMLFTKGKRGWPITLIALFFSLVGILFGVYITYYQLAETGSGLFSMEVAESFFEGLDENIDGSSGFWTFLALLAAWKMTSRLRIKVNEKDAASK